MFHNYLTCKLQGVLDCDSTIYYVYALYQY